MGLKSGQRFVFGAASARVKNDTFVRYLFASDYVAGKVVLDAACGSGFGTFFLAQEASQVWGVDASPEAIEYAKANYSRPNITFAVFDLTKELNLGPGTFDVVVSFHTIEQLPDQKTFVKNIHRILKNAGVALLSTPNKKVVSPFNDKPIGKFNKVEFYRSDLEKLLAPYFKVEWYGQRCTLTPLTWWPIRRLIRLLEIIFGKNFGFYGVRESYRVQKLKWWREPKDFVLVMRKKS